MGKTKFKWDWIIGAYMGTGMIVTLFKLMAGRFLVAATRPWYNKIFGDVEPFTLMISVFTWPRYLYMGVTEGWDAVILDLHAGYR